MEKISELKVIVLEPNISIKTYENVRIIRIKSDNYNLLIMKDYWPVVGEINGNVTIEKEELIEFNNIKAFYSLSDNIFHLIIKDKND